MSLIVVLIKFRIKNIGLSQAHRKVLGVISLGSCASQIELNELCRLHEAFKAKYSSTLYDTRCVVFCDRRRCGDLDEPDSQSDGETEKENQANHRNRGGGEEEDGEVVGGLDKPPSWFQPQNHKTRLLQFQGTKYSAGLKADIQANGEPPDFQISVKSCNLKC
jgi:hypothetical protein